MMTDLQGGKHKFSKEEKEKHRLQHDSNNFLHAQAMLQDFERA